MPDSLYERLARTHRVERRGRECELQLDSSTRTRSDSLPKRLQGTCMQARNHSHPANSGQESLHRPSPPPPDFSAVMYLIPLSACSAASSPEFNSSRFPQSSRNRGTALPTRHHFGHSRTRHHSDPNFGPFPTPTRSLLSPVHRPAARLALALGSRLPMVCLARKLDHGPAAPSSSSTTKTITHPSQLAPRQVTLVGPLRRPVVGQTRPDGSPDSALPPSPPERCDDDGRRRRRRRGSPPNRL